MTHRVNVSPTVIERDSVRNCLLEQQDERHAYGRILKVTFCESYCRNA